MKMCRSCGHFTQEKLFDLGREFLPVREGIRILIALRTPGATLTRQERGMSWEIDFIEELQLRRWARENYVPAPQRQRNWHPVVIDEMSKKDGEQYSTSGSLQSSKV